MTDHDIRVSGYIPVSAGAEVSEDGITRSGTPQKSVVGMEITTYLCSCGAEFEAEEAAIEHYREYNES